MRTHWCHVNTCCYDHSFSIRFGFDQLPPRLVHHDNNTWSKLFSNPIQYGLVLLETLLKIPLKTHIRGIGKARRKEKEDWQDYEIDESPSHIVPPWACSADRRCGGVVISYTIPKS